MSIDLSWAQEQIAAARVPIPVGKAVVELLTHWGPLTFQTDTQRDQALELFAKLAINEAVIESTDDEFVPVRVGFMLSVGDTVRVRSDAFSGDAGRSANGRVGRVVGKRTGDIVVNSTDGKKPTLSSVHFKPDQLEKKVN